LKKPLGSTLSLEDMARREMSGKKVAERVLRDPVEGFLMKRAG
jgi:hypothetical protein